MKKTFSAKAVSMSLTLLMIVSSLAILPFNKLYAQQPDTMTFKSPTTMQFWSGEKMSFGTNVTAQFVEYPGPGDLKLYPCELIQIIWPPGYIPYQCSWWEVIDPITGQPTGMEFHLDGGTPPYIWHVDMIYVPGGGNFIPYQLPFKARLKVDIIEPCRYYEAHWPSSWYPRPCTWWEIIDPETGHLTGVEFHVDWTNESCKFHIDQVLVNGQPGIYILPFPECELWARRKISFIDQCQYFVVEEPAAWYPNPCSWWEILDHAGAPTGFEFHVDWTNESCEFHIDEMYPGPYTFMPVPYVTAVQKIVTITRCDWYIVTAPTQFLPEPCTWWEILDDAGAPTGLEFHVDTTDGISMFHIDEVNPGTVITIPPSYTVTARPRQLPPQWYMKPSYPDYAQSGMPDFDQRQGGTYLWMDQAQRWSHCGPVAVANSLWWLDSEFETNTIPPPAIIDNYPLVTAYGQWDDHGPQNVPPLVEHLAYLMDTDGKRTHIAKLGTNVLDMQAGITHYLSWSGVNPLGDVDGDGSVTQLDQNIVIAAMGTVPGVPGWDLRADIFPVTTGYPPVADNAINMNDLMLVQTHMGLTGRFYEHTVMAPMWEIIVNEVLRCQDVVLLIAPWVDLGGGNWYRYEEGAHFVTVAGLNATTREIVLSDPINNNAEAGGPGDVPLPHVHPPVEPPFTTHNNASLVSHDMYPVVIDPCPGGPLTLIGYPGSIINPQGAKWQIEAAVITSPLGIHDIAITDVKPNKTITSNVTYCNVSVTVTNEGSFTETFNVTLQVQSMPPPTNVSKILVSNLLSGETRTITFVWSTLGWSKLTYTLIACADTVTGEVDTADNKFIDGNVQVTMLCDVNGDHTCDMADISLLIDWFMTSPPKWEPNCDINDDLTIDMADISLAIDYFMQVDC